MTDKKSKIEMRRLSEFHVGDFDDSHLEHLDGLNRRGLMLALSAPSGTGKTTMTRKLLEQDGDVELSISATTRAPRNGEEDGVHYHFISKEEFQRLVAEKEFLEHTKIHGNYYGTMREKVVAALEAGHDVLFDIDTPGVEQLAAFARSDLVSVFILPPSFDEMAKRLRARGQDSEEVIKRRLADAENQIIKYDEYDYVIINRDLEDSMLKLRTILGAERMKRSRLRGLDALGERLVTEVKEYHAKLKAE